MARFEVIKNKSIPQLDRSMLTAKNLQEKRTFTVYHEGELSPMSEGYVFATKGENPREFFRSYARELAKIKGRADRAKKYGNKLKINFFVGNNFSGKTSTVRKLNTDYGVPEIVSHTTREAREGEVHGKDYFFVSPEDFDTIPMAEKVSFGGKSYGLAFSSLREAFANSSMVNLVVEPNGIIEIREFLKQADLDIDTFVVFMDPKNREAIAEKMIQEGKIDKEEYEKRIQRGDIPGDMKRLGITPDLVVDILDEKTVERVARAIGVKGNQGQTLALFPDLQARLAERREEREEEKEEVGAEKDEEVKLEIHAPRSGPSLSF